MTPSRITPEALEEYRKKCGTWYANTPFYEEANVDAFRHFAHGVGDGNPLWSDPAYAARTRWGGSIAPPHFLYTYRRGRYWTMGLPGVATLWAGDAWEWFQPVRPGDRIVAKTRFLDMVKVKSEHAGEAYDQHSDIVYIKASDKTLVARHDYLNKRFERERTKDAPRQKRFEDYKPHVYTKDEIAAISADYARETRRGSEPRYWEDVQVGELLTPVVKGPLTITDEIAFLMGAGEPLVHTGRLAWEYFQRHPGANVPDKDTGVPDIPARIHWEEKLARAFGAPTMFDIGAQRVCWMGHLMTNWVGDDGFLRKMSMQARGFNLLGDTFWVRGKVTSKAVQEGEHLADVEMWCENQRGEITTPGSATVLLPSRESGAVRLPYPPRDLP